jgi:hypothetical protein
VSFVDLFADDLEPPPLPEPPVVHERPVWIGPPEGELGVAVPLGLVLARSDRGVVALSHAVAHSTGITLELVAHVSGLDRRRMNVLFHEQHDIDTGGADPPDGFLRFGLELAGGARVSNLGGRRPWASPEETPSAPVLVRRGGGGGQSSGTSISWSIGFWLWPLPPPGALQVYCEWPVAGIALAAAELDTAPLLDAAARAERIWEPGERLGGWTSSAASQIVMSHGAEEAAPADDETLQVPAAELREAREALQAALRALRRLER